MRKPDPRASWIRSTLEQYERPLLRYVVQITGDLDSARDVVQDAFIRLCEQEDWRSLEANVKAWLYRVCRNRALDCKKKDRSMRNVADAELKTYPSKEPDAAARIESRQSQKALVQLIEQLPDRQREVVRLKFDQGLSYQEISTITGHSVSNVGYLLHHGVRALRDGMVGAKGGTASNVGSAAQKGGVQ